MPEWDDAPCGLLRTTPDGTVTAVNATFLAWTQLERDAVLGRPLGDLLSAGGRIFYETHVRPMLRLQGAVRELALELACATGELPVVLNAAVADDAVHVALFDARERMGQERELVRLRRAEREARERTERLQRLTARLVAAADEQAVAQSLLDELLPAVGATTGRVVLGEAVAAQVGEPAALLTFDLPGPGRLEVDLAEPGAPALALLTAGAAQASQALDRVRLHERAERLAEVGRELLAVQGVEDRADRLGRLLVPGFADAVVVDLPGEDEVEPVFVLAGTPSRDAMALAERPGGTVGPAIVTLTLPGRDRPVGTLVLERRAPRTFTDADVEHARQVADRAALAFTNARLAEHERSIAHELQRSLLAGELPRDSRLRLATHYRPAVDGLEVGGDWYDAFPIAGDRVAVVVGDVVGRGVRAASAMGQLRSAIRALAASRLGPAEVLERLDRFVEHQPSAQMATLAYLELALDSGRVRFACAGHPPPVRSGRGGTELLWTGRSAPLGAYFGAERRLEDELVLAPGDRLLLYTDGLVERRDEPLHERLESLVATVAGCRDVPPGAMLEAVTTSLADDRPADDVCAVVLAYGVDRDFERVVGGDPTELAPLRADLRTWLAGNDVDPSAGAGIVLACAEAVANGIEHGLAGLPSGTVTVRGHVESGEVALCVHDGGSWQDTPSGLDRGRGLQIMRSVMDCVEVDRTDGTLVRMRHRRIAA